MSCGQHDHIVKIRMKLNEDGTNEKTTLITYCKNEMLLRIKQFC